MQKSTIRGEKPANLVQTIERTALILEVLGLFPKGLSLGALAEKVSLPKGTTHRLLTSLAYFDFVRQDDSDKHYSLGFRLVELGNLLLSHIDLRKEAHPHLVALSESVEETVHLVILDQNKALYIDKVDMQPRRGGLQMVSTLGARIPLYCTAVGKVLLAAMPEQTAEQIIRNEERSRLASNTITDPKDIMEHLGKIRCAGYAIDDEENEEGVRCVAAPIRDNSGRVIAAISISGSTTRISYEKIETFLKLQVMQTAKRISTELGFSAK